MIRTLLLLSLALLGGPAMADDHADHEHVAEAEGIRAVHAWTNATRDSTALVYVEIDNGSAQAALLTGASAGLVGSARLVGLDNAAGRLRYVEIPQMPIPAGSRLALSPNGLAIQLSGLRQALVEGQHFELELQFQGLHLDVDVEIESATARQHSHAGHRH